MKAREILKELLADKLERYGIGESELNDRFDLVRSGLLNSLEFVEVISMLEKRLEREIDYEHAISREDFTTIKGVIRNFE